MKQIHGKVPGDIKAVAWRKIAGYNPFEGDKLDIDGVLERIAICYDLPVEDVAAELSVSDILPVYMDCVRYVNGLVFEKLNQLPKKKVVE